MHRRVFLFVLLSAILLSFVMIQSPTNARPPYAGTPTSGVKGIVVASDSLRIRIRPDTTSAETGSPLKPQTQITVLGRNDSGVWLVVQTQTGVTGWVSSAYVALLSGSMKDIPVLADNAVETMATSAATAEAPEGTACPPGASGTPAPLTGFKGIVVAADSLRIHSQPLTTAPEVADPLKPKVTVTVLGRNDSGTWLVVQTSAGVIGWVGSPYVQMSTADLKATPVMDDNAVDTLTAQASGTSAACPPEGTPAAATAAAPTTGFKGIVVSSDTLRIRSTPATTSPEVASPLKPRASVIVLGRNADGVWLYIQTAAGDKGWVSSAYVQLVSGGSLKDLPVLNDSGSPAQ